MTVEELLQIKPVTFEVSSLSLKDGSSFVQSLVNEGIPVDSAKRVNIRTIQTIVESLPEEQRDRILAWEIDEASEVETVGLDVTVPPILPDSKVVTHVNNVTVWTLCLTTLMFVGSISWNIVVNHEYPKVTLGLVAIGPITLCALWVIGVLRNRQSLMSVVLGDGEAKETVAQAVLRAVANRK